MIGVAASPPPPFMKRPVFITVARCDAIAHGAFWREVRVDVHAADLFVEIEELRFVDGGRH